MKTDGPDVPYWAKRDSRTTDRARTFPIGGGHRARFF
jgi:hypothetical protein